MFKVILSILPFIVCLGWSVVLFLRGNKSLPQHRILTVFAILCSLLYACHASYFNQINNLFTESLWVLCSLASYPLYLLYLLSITTAKPFLLARMHFFLPAIAISLLRYIVNEPWVDTLRQVVFIVSVLLTCVVGLIMLLRFEKNILNLYADIEHRSSRPIQVLLVCFVVTSVLSAAFNLIGRKVFLSDSLLLAVPSLLFSTMLYLLFFIGNRYEFSLEKMEEEVAIPDEQLVNDMESTNHLGAILSRLMDDEQVFLRHDLKLSELAKEVGTCRTYLSAYINTDLNMSFSDYINSHRIRYARDLMKTSPKLPLDEVALKSGFSSLTTFKRNLDKFSR